MRVDTTIVALALPSLAQQFPLSNSTASAVTLSYSIPMTLLIVPIGVVINRFRPLTAFPVSVAGFGTGSALCGPNLIKTWGTYCGTDPLRVKP